MILSNLCDFIYLFHIFKWVMYLKKTLEIVGLSVLICFSFVLTEKTAVLIKDNDILMSTVKENKTDLEQASIDAKIINDEIIPGISGRKVDVDKSYQAMKKVGTYHESLIVYKNVTPTVSLSDTYDKYIVSGNQRKKQISIIFKMNNSESIDGITELLNKNKMTANFFVESNWANANIEKIKSLSIQGHIIGRLNYLDEANLLQSIIKINTNQNKYYCYCEKKNESILNTCSKNKEYTILPSIVIEKSLLSNVMKSIQSGSIISITMNKNILQELSNTLDYIKAKGYAVVNLDTLLEE